MSWENGDPHPGLLPSDGREGTLNACFEIGALKFNSRNPVSLAHRMGESRGEVDRTESIAVTLAIQFNIEQRTSHLELRTAWMRCGVYSHARIKR